MHFKRIRHIFNTWYKVRKTNFYVSIQLKTRIKLNKNEYFAICYLRDFQKFLFYQMFTTTFKLIFRNEILFFLRI